MNRKEEEKILDEKLEIIRRQIASLEEEYKDLYNSTIEKRENLREERSSLKYNDVSSELKRINKYISKCNHINTKIKKLRISEKVPYFSCVKFSGDEFYFGKLGVKDENGLVIINDWRAPVASLYYDFETGPAYFLTPEGRKIEGIIENKKQYKIENSKLIYCFETNVEVVDEILQRTLAENSSSHMKTIVASIQKEQNKIIREPADKSIVVQGVAGSGKTSIALHRIAYLLYNNKEFKNKKVFILSPNKVFSNYISTVLPELGERKAEDISMEEILNETFGNLIPFSTKFSDIEAFLKNENLYNQHKIKISNQFYLDLKEFLKNYFVEAVKFKDLKIKNTVFEKDHLINLFNEKTDCSLFNQFEFLSNYIISLLNVKKPLTYDEENSLKPFIIAKLLKNVSADKKNIIKIYKEFLKTKGLTTRKGRKFSYDDAINLLFVKNYVFGPDKKDAVHLVIDELQDLSPVCLDVINQIFNCTKTSLGDVYQKVDGSVDENLPKIASEILNANEEPIVLKTIYRSSKQIAEFSSNILNLKDVTLINRNGDDVEIVKTQNLNQTLSTQIEALKKKYKNIAVITKTFAEAYAISKAIGIKLISPISQRYKTGVVTTPAYLAKGLEFDAVIIANANSLNFATELDRQQLYVGCTRALHKLIINHSDKLTKFIRQ